MSKAAVKRAVFSSFLKVSIDSEAGGADSEKQSHKTLGRQLQ